MDINFDYLKQNITGVIGENLSNINSEDGEALRMAYSRAINQVMDVLQQSGYNQNIQGKAQEFLYESMEEIGRTISTSRENKSAKQYESIEYYINGNELEDAVSSGDDINSAISRFISSSLAKLQEVTESIDKEESMKTRYTIEDSIQTVLKDKFRRLLNVYDDRKGEEVYSIVSNLLTRKLEEELEEKIQDNTKLSNNVLYGKASGILEEFSKEDLTNQLKPKDSEFIDSLKAGVNKESIERKPEEKKRNIDWFIE